MTDFLTSDFDLAPRQPAARRPSIAATVDAGLAGLLSNVLTNQRRLESTTQVESVEAIPVEAIPGDPVDVALNPDSSKPPISIETDEALFEDSDEESLFDEDETDWLFAEVQQADGEDEFLFGDEDDHDAEEEFLFDTVEAEDEDDTEADIQAADQQPIVAFLRVADGGSSPIEVLEAPTWSTAAGPAAPAQTVTHVVVHHVMVQAPPTQPGSPTTSRSGPAVAHSVATVEHQGTIPKLRDAFDPFDTAVDTEVVPAPPVSFTPQVAAELASSNKINFDNNPVFLIGVTPTPSAVAAEKNAPPPPARVARILSPLQINLLIEGLAQVRSRPGEEGLPPGMLLMDVRGPLGRFQTDSLYTIRSQIDGAVRGGDMALVVPDIGIVLFCGGLFFPGDLEVMGSRLRRRALDANPSALPSDAIRVTVAGALACPADDAIEFVKRGVETFDLAVETEREDIVIDYVDPRRLRV